MLSMLGRLKEQLVPNEEEMNAVVTEAVLDYQSIIDMLIRAGADENLKVIILTYMCYVFFIGAVW